MRHNRSFIRKVVYIAIIALLLIPLSFLSQPATSSGSSASQDDEALGRTGGKLARLRLEYKLSQANLGEIDPASETMKLATLGLKGVAANLLWHQANEYKKKKMWDRLTATVIQITKLQPNFETIWEFQAHNLAYNVSAQFDNYEHRYHWVKKGLNFLMDGTRYNSTSHRLFWYTGWIIGQKIGRSDEFKQFRALFKEDTDYRTKLLGYVRDQMSKLPLTLQKDFDNWIMAHLWFVQAEHLATLRGARPLKMSKPVFYQSSAKALINYARAISEEVRPEIGGITHEAWKYATKAWKDFGNYEMRTPWDDIVTLNQLAATEAELKELRAELDTEISPGARDEIAKEKRANLKRTNPKMLAAYDEVQVSDDPSSLPGETLTLADEAGPRLAVTDEDVANRAPDNLKDRAGEVLREILRLRDDADRIRMYRSHTNYDYWALRCRAESEDDFILARQAVFDARDLMEKKKYTSVEKLDTNGDVIPVLDDNGQQVRDENGEPVYEMEDGARQKFELAWTHWANVFNRDEYKELVTDLDTDSLMPPIKEYRNLLLDLYVEPAELPIDFKLFPLLTGSRQKSFRVPSVQEVVNVHFQYVEDKLHEAQELADRGILETGVAKDEDGKPIQQEDVTGNKLFGEDGKPIYKIQPGARETFEVALAHAAKMFTKGPPGLINHARTAEIAKAIPEYRKVVKKLGEPDIPLDSPIMVFLSARDGKDNLPTPGEIRAAHSATNPASKKDEAKPSSDENNDQKSNDQPTQPGN